MKSFTQSPTDDAFVQNPYPFYEMAREEAGAMFYWQDYNMPCAVSYAAVWAILKDRRFGREEPAQNISENPPHQADFWAIEKHSLLQLEPPKHTRLRGLILRAFTSRKIAGMGPDIAALAHQMIDQIEGDTFDLIPSFAQQLPAIVIARLLGVPEDRVGDLLAWSHAIVGMYQARRDHTQEVVASKAAQEFSDFLTDYISFRRGRPGDDLITSLIAAEEDGKRLTREELISTCILLLNAGHEATVHTIGNGVKAMLETEYPKDLLAPENIAPLIEEILRFDAPLHMFTRYVYEDVEVGRHTLRAGTQVACLLGAANRDPARWYRADQFDPMRAVQTNASFGAGVHFCIGAPLARLELQIALPILFERCPNLAIENQPRYSNAYHFHGLSSLWVRR